MLAKAVADYLQTRGLGTVGSTIFVDELPQDTITGLAVIANGGNTVNVDLPIYSQEVELFARGADSETTYGLLDTAKKIFDRNHHFTIGDYYVYFTMPITEIINLGRDMNNSKMYQITIQLIYRDTDTVS